VRTLVGDYLEENNVERPENNCVGFDGRFPCLFVPRLLLKRRTFTAGAPAPALALAVASVSHVSQVSPVHAPHGGGDDVDEGGN
jgi:hypothetical protein